MRHSVTCHASRVSVSFLMTEADDEAVLGRGTVRERGRDVTEAEVTRLVSTEAGVRLVSVHQGWLGGLSPRQIFSFSLRDPLASHTSLKDQNKALQ